MRTLDSCVALSTAAALTSVIRLGTAVALPAEHDPIALAKAIASLDQLSATFASWGPGSACPSRVVPGGADRKANWCETGQFLGGRPPVGLARRLWTRSLT
jgi:alkanesulfonate monooxygenase SsuD/methylene tetrahydromethanopterin reductase-like flavin-dependent oxidoreductase (luciferase family)